MRTLSDFYTRGVPMWRYNICSVQRGTDRYRQPGNKVCWAAQTTCFNSTLQY